MIRSLEELSFNAWPSLRTMHYDGWVLRFADGYTRRANSVNPIYSSTLPLEEKIRFCEEVYSQNEQQTIFKMTSDALPEGLDEALEKRRYRKEAVTSVQTMDLKKLTGSTTGTVSTIHSSMLSDEWFSDFCALHPQTQGHRGAMVQMVDGIVPETAYMTLKEDGETVAVGLAVREGVWVGLFDIVTDPQQRRKGYATTLVCELLRWGHNQGAKRAYLQVMLNNAPALDLYRKLGFAEEYRYWYRIRDR